jgi:hypothetical protein
METPTMRLVMYSKESLTSEKEARDAFSRLLQAAGCHIRSRLAFSAAAAVFAVGALGLLPAGLPALAAVIISSSFFLRTSSNFSAYCGTPRNVQPADNLAGCQAHFSSSFIAGGLQCSRSIQ